MSEKPLLQFPCKFPIKAMGLAIPNFETTIFKIVQQYAPELTQANISTRPSKDGKYLAVTATIEATSQEQLDNIYLALTASDKVVMCL